MPGHLWGHQSRSHRERSLVRADPEEGILVGVSVKEEGVGADGTSETTRAVGTVEGVQAAKADGTSETTRAVGTVEGVRTIPAVKRVILVGEGIQARAEGETRNVDPTRAFFIRVILRVLWRRVLR